MDEKRRFSRTSLRLTTIYKIPKTGRTQRALTHDISGGGIRFIADEELAPGVPLEIEVKLPDQESPIVCQAEVVWSKVTNPDRKSYEDPIVETGAKFVQIDEKEQALLIQYARINAPPQ